MSAIPSIEDEISSGRMPWRACVCFFSVRGKGMGNRLGSVGIGSIIIPFSLGLLNLSVHRVWRRGRTDGEEAISCGNWARPARAAVV
jgi:hypothetical protein